MVLLNKETTVYSVQPNAVINYLTSSHIDEHTKPYEKQTIDYIAPQIDRKDLSSRNIPTQNLLDIVSIYRFYIYP